MKSSARRPEGGWFKQNYDKLGLVVSLVILLLSAAILVVKIGQTREAPSSSRKGAEKKAEAVDQWAFSNLVQSLEAPYQVPEDKRRMLVGELRVASVPDGLPISYNAAVCPFTGAVQPPVQDPRRVDSDGDGISDALEKEYGFDPNNPLDVQQDTDGDGFLTFEEFSREQNAFISDPRDKASCTPVAAKLRVEKVVVKPFRLRFLGVSELGGTARYQLNLQTLERTYFPTMNEVIKEEGYKVVAYEPKTAGGKASLTLVKDEETIRLVEGEVVSRQSFVAHLILLLDGSKMSVQNGSSVKLRDASYKVVDIREDRVVLRDDISGKDIVIPLIAVDDGRTGPVK